MVPLIVVVVVVVVLLLLLLNEARCLAVRKAHSTDYSFNNFLARRETGSDSQAGQMASSTINQQGLLISARRRLRLKCGKARENAKDFLLIMCKVVPPLFLSPYHPCLSTFFSSLHVWPN